MNGSFLPGLTGLVLLVAACSGAPPSEEGPSSEEEGRTPGPEATLTAEAGRVAELTQALLAALSAADTASLARLLVPGAAIHSVRETETGPSLRTVSREEFLLSLGGEGQELLERMWDPVVFVDGAVAVVWTPYDFHLDGEFSHCGTDVFSFLKGPEGWQVASITYNVVRGGCPPSPLSSPERSRP